MPPSPHAPPRGMASSASSGARRLRRLVPIGAAALALGAMWIWMGVRQEQERAERFAHAIEHASRHLADYVRVRIANAEAIASLRSAGMLDDEERFRRHSEVVQIRLGGYFAINWIGMDGIIRWVAPLEPNRRAIGRNVFHHPQAGVTARRARERSQRAVTDPIRLFQDRNGFAAYLPVRRNGTFMGFVNPVFDLHHVLNASLGAAFEDRIALHIAGSDGHVFETPGFEEAWHLDPRTQRHIDLPGNRWFLRAAPAPGARIEPLNPLRHVLLALGLLALGLIALLRERQAEQAELAAELERTRRQLARAVAESPDVVAQVDTAGRLLLLNETARKTLSEEASGSDLLQHTPASHRALLRDAMQRALRTGEVSRTTLPFGHAGRMHEVALAPLRDDHGRIDGLLLHARDEQERIDMRRQLARSQRLEAVGRLAGGVAHDFNNVLAAITAMASMLREEHPEAAPDLESITEAAQRGGALTRKLLAFARHASSEPHQDPGRMDRVLSGMRKLLRSLLKGGVELRIELPEEPLWTPLPEAEAEQVLVNLALNAIDAMAECGGTLHVTLRAEAHHAVLRVRDEGHGMPPDVLEHAFEPFFTTKEPGRGSGLGLASVYGLVRAAGGEVHIESQPGQGTLVEVRLPRIPAPDTPHDSPPSGSVSLNGLHILLAEDDDMLRRTVGRWLRARGASVYETEDGESALLQFERRSSIDLLVTDVVMPRMGGLELAEALRARGFTGPVVLVSGYAHEAIDLRGAAKLPGPLLHKPFRPEALLATIHELLGVQQD